MNKCIKNINNMKLNNKPLVDVVIDNLQEPPYKSFYSTKKVDIVVPTYVLVCQLQFS